MIQFLLILFWFWFASPHVICLFQCFISASMMYSSVSGLRPWYILVFQLCVHCIFQCFKSLSVGYSSVSNLRLWYIPVFQLCVQCFSSASVIYSCVSNLRPCVFQCFKFASVIYSSVSNLRPWYIPVFQVCVRDIFQRFSSASVLYYSVSILRSWHNPVFQIYFRGILQWLTIRRFRCWPCWTVHLAWGFSRRVRGVLVVSSHLSSEATPPRVYNNIGGSQTRGVRELSRPRLRCLALIPSSWWGLLKDARCCPPLVSRTTPS